MGLDMYLHARRNFAPDAPELGAVLSAANSSLDALMEMRAQYDADPMQFEGSLYLSAWSHNGNAESERCLAVLDAGGMRELFTAESPSAFLGWDGQTVYLQTTAIYWRKTNAVHAWFVERCQGGVDECQESDPIDFELLAELASNCKKAVEAHKAGDDDKAMELMAPRPGFFFGSTELDEWWEKDLLFTAEELEKVVTTAIRLGGIQFTYHSSW